MSRPTRFAFVSTMALIVSNLVPLWGVCFRGWEVFTVMLLFWLENVVIGLFNVLRMAAVPSKGAGPLIFKFTLIPFFMFHYGMFALAHGVFVFALFCPQFIAAGDALQVDRQLSLAEFWALIRPFIPASVPMALLALTLSHGVSYFANFIGRGEYRTADLDTLMMDPYRRVVLLHLTLIAGAFIVNGIGAQRPVMAVLVLLKIGMDLYMHRAERKRFVKRAEAATVKA